MSVLESLLRHCQDQAAMLDGSDSPKNLPSQHDTRGLGGVTLLFHPYDRGWAAKADWSDSSELVTPTFESPVDATTALRDMLAEEAKTCSWEIGRATFKKE